MLVTGASSGIGLACARELTAAGARVAALSRGGDALRDAAGGLAPSPLVVTADVADPTATKAAIDEAARSLGGLDVVVANAGAAAYGPFTDMSPDDYTRTVNTTLLGLMNTVHAALPHLERTRGTLVVIGSIAGRVPTPWLAAYSSAKHGVRGFVRSLRGELSALDKPVDIALIAPGPVDSPFWKHARSTDGRLPPEIRGAYRPEAVAAEVLRALRNPRMERSVGGAMAVWAFLDALAPNLTLRVAAPLMKLGWSKRESRPLSPFDGLANPAEEAKVEGGLRSRGSIAGRLRDLIGGRHE